MQAYKCDECGEFFEGAPEEIRDQPNVGRYIVAAAVGIAAEPVEAEPEVELSSLEKLLGLDRRKTAKKRVAELCEPCATAIIRASLNSVATWGERVST